MAGFQLEGLGDVLKKINALAKNVQKKHVKKALRAAAKPVHKAAKDNAQKVNSSKTTDEIAKNIVVRAGKSSDKNAFRIRVGVKGGGEFWRQNKMVQRKGKPREDNPHYTFLDNDTRHFWLVEFGTAKTKAKPFLRPALEDNVQSATEAFADQIKKDILTDIS